MIKRRDTTRLIYDILCLATRGASKYLIITQVGLSFSQAESYLSFLLSKGHLQLSKGTDGVKLYTLTPKGEWLRNPLAEVQEELDGLFAKTPASPSRSINHLKAIDKDLGIDNPTHGADVDSSEITHLTAE